MNSIDFISVPLIGDLMIATGVNDGWLIVCALLGIMLVVCVIALIVDACKTRSRNKEMLEMRRELLGLQALTSLPPLHQGDAANSSDSVVFASFEELKERQIENAREQRAAFNAQREDERAQAMAALRERKVDPRHADACAAPAQDEPVAYEPASASAVTQEYAPVQASDAPGNDNVTAQVHEAIYASVTGRLDAVKVPQPKRQKRAKGAPITGDDLPPVRSRSTAPKHVAQHKESAYGSDLSGRIPRL